MPQARLPDINTAYIKYRNEVVWALKHKMYNLMHGALVGINALLPVEYQVVVSSEEYNKLAKTEITYFCNKCEFENPKESVKVYDLLPNRLDFLLHGNNLTKVWNCTKCHSTNKLKETPISKTVLQNPTFLGVVPDPPERKDGLMDRMKFNIEIERWAWLYLGELEFKLAKFRDDNWNKGEELGLDIDTSIEESTS